MSSLLLFHCLVFKKHFYCFYSGVCTPLGACWISPVSHSVCFLWEFLSWVLMPRSSRARERCTWQSLIHHRFQVLANFYQKKFYNKILLGNCHSISKFKFKENICKFLFHDHNEKIADLGSFKTEFVWLRVCTNSTYWTCYTNEGIVCNRKSQLQVEVSWAKRASGIRCATPSTPRPRPSSSPSFTSSFSAW